MVDDYLPVGLSEEGKYIPVNTKVSRFGAWWLPILEKAYAKVNGFYANLMGGSE